MIFTLEYQSLCTHKDGGIMGTKHLVILEADTESEAINEASRRFGNIGTLGSSPLKTLKRKGIHRHRVSKKLHLAPAFV